MRFTSTSTPIRFPRVRSRVEHRPLILADRAVAARIEWLLAVAANPGFSDSDARTLTVLGILTSPESYGLEPAELLKIIPGDVPLESRAPSAADLARIASTDVRTVRRSLAKARSAGFLITREAGGGRGRRASYALSLPAAAAPRKR